LNNGLHPRKGIEPPETFKVEAIDKFVNEAEMARTTAIISLKKAAEVMKLQYNKHGLPARQYKAGDKVYLNAEHLPTLRQSKKLDSKYYGPFEILEKIGASAFRLRVPASWRVYNVFNEALLKPYHAPRLPLQIKREANCEKERQSDGNNEEYEVDLILDSRISRRGRG
jgi:hypothetical protein